MISHCCTGVPRSIGEQSLSSAAVGSRSKSTQATLQTPAVTDSPVAPLSTASVPAASQTDNPIQDRSLKFANLQQAWANLAALQELEHVRVTHTGDGAHYLEMVMDLGWSHQQGSLAGAGLLALHMCNMHKCGRC